MTLTEWAQRILSDPIITEEDVNDLQNAFHKGVFNDIRFTSILRFSDNIDWINSTPLLKEMLAIVCLNFLLDDTSETIALGQVDWISKQKGDLFVREFNKLIIPFDYKEYILLKIEENAKNILSNNLLNEIISIKN